MVERVVTVALLCILFDGGMHLGWPVVSSTWLSGPSAPAIVYVSSVVRQSCAGGREISGSDSVADDWAFLRGLPAVTLVFFVFGFAVVADT